MERAHRYSTPLLSFKNSTKEQLKERDKGRREKLHTEDMNPRKTLLPLLILLIIQILTVKVKTVHSTELEDVNGK